MPATVPSLPRHRSFDVARSASKQRPVTFDLGGESFKCVPEMPASSFLALAEITRQGGSTFAGMVEFLDSLLADDGEVRRFGELLRRKKDPVPFDVLMEVIQWLGEEYSGTPTGPPSA